MRRERIFKCLAAVLALLVFALPIALLRYGRRLPPSNPIASQSETLPQAETEPVTAEPSAMQPEERTPEAEITPDAPGARAVQPILRDDTPAASASPSQAGIRNDVADRTYGFVEADGITASGTAAGKKTAQPLSPVTPAAPAQEAAAPAAPAEPSASPVVIPAAPQPQTPRLVTDLDQFAVVTQAENPQGELCFSAYGDGGEDLSVRVRAQAAGELAETLLRGTAEGKYTFPMTLGKTYTFYLSLYQGGALYASPVRYTVEYRATLANAGEPTIGGGVELFTNLDHLKDGTVLESAVRTLRVSARTVPEGQALHADAIRVTLNGALITSMHGGDDPEYDLHFAAPNVGEYSDYLLEVVAWHGADSAYRQLHLRYHAVPDGADGGTVRVRLDATVLGLDILDEETIAFSQGETAADVLLRFLTQCGYTVTYDADTFYIRAVSRPGMCDDFTGVPQTMRDLLDADNPLHEEQFDPDSLAEFQYTRLSGWIYTVNGIVYGRGLDAMTVSDGDALSLRFTLMMGRDADYALPEPDTE